ncbi:PglZ domain-containing protein [Nostoc punctiforme FACHB-252]|uniref:PglZ domain-containing protein n=1 Tax=Nostoc punctiforme FACHB-252 TaxID=1357509 RepID=A0ABR8HKG5_NOSPU|nr:PglZ domain-containing protein [Nostoc punctiforme]MBD2615871.1 PglZ domain-containing protein [Nostoc punctiforme FACHB-252]
MSIPSTLDDYTLQWLTKLPKAAKLVIWLDPYALLELADHLVDNRGKSWQILSYRGDDFRFRSRLNHLNKAQPAIIWIRPPIGKVSPLLDLTYLADLLNRHDGILDLRLESILAEVTPYKAWPSDLATQGNLAAPQLGALANAAKLFHHITNKSVLNSHDLKLLLLHIRQPELTLELLCNIPSQSPASLLTWYLRIILTTPSNDLNPSLVELIGAFPMPAEFLEFPATDLICFSYAYHAATVMLTPQAVDRLLWLPRLSSDHLLIIESALTLLQEDKTTWTTLFNRAEQLLTLEKLSDLVRQFTTTKQEIASRTDLSGIWVAAVCIAIEESRPLEEFDPDVYTPRPLIGNYCDVAQTLQQALAVSRKVDSHLSQARPVFNDISNLLEWYRTEKIHTQELEISRAIRGVIKLKQLPGQLLENIIEQLQNLRSQWRDFLNLLDENLADLVTGSNWSKFCHHPRHSTQFLSDALPSSIPNNTRVWFLIFDGMRLDAWDLVIRPILEDHFQIEEKLYLTSLPSITDIARIALIAGTTPEQWKNASGIPIKNHNFLAAKKFKIPQDHRDQELQIIVRSETVAGQMKLGLGEEDAKKYNILIYNVSDDWIHNWRDDLALLNDFIQKTLVESILPDLKSRINPQDIVVLSSDHGFVELDLQEQIKITEINSHDVRYRYLKTDQAIHGKSVSYGRSEYTYQVAVGRQWFNRPDSHKMERFTHGGISLDEMVVPGAILKPITKQIRKLELLDLPSQLLLSEDEEIKLVFSILNSGTQRSSFLINWRIDDNQPQFLQQELVAGTHTPVTLTFLGHLGQQILTIELLDTEGTRHAINRISLQISARHDKVEFSDPLAGLDFND